MKKYETKTHRIIKCEHTQKEILQQKGPDGKWICLHNENEIVDQASVDAFKSAF